MRILARTALAAYTLPETRLRLVNHLWNTTFRIDAADGSRYLLRIHHPGQRSVAAVDSELLWLAALREETDLMVPEPVRNRAQSLVTVSSHSGVPEPRLCVLFRWIEGRFLHKGLAPDHLFQVGGLLARLHHHASDWRRPEGFRRHRVENLDPMRRDEDDNFAAARAAWAAESVSALLTPEAGDCIAAAVEKIWSLLRALGEGHEVFGLIHADLHYRNFLFHQGSAGAIDFDDCGLGHWHYDLAVTLSELQVHPRYPALRQALLAGYRQRRALSREETEHLETFLALRRVQDLLGFIGEREHPAFRDQWQASVERELQSLREFVRGAPPPP
jgi:Ser/Thr protein kinase RdoA (MazF antagonist)